MIYQLADSRHLVLRRPQPREDVNGAHTLDR